MATGSEQTIANWFNRACVTAPTDPSQPFGNAERNSVSGPKFWQLDLAASKRVALGGPAQFEVRIEAFNLLNKTNFRAPNSNRSAAAFGTITSTFDPRQVQLGFKRSGIVSPPATARQLASATRLRLGDKLLAEGKREGQGKRKGQWRVVIRRRVAACQCAAGVAAPAAAVRSDRVAHGGRAGIAEHTSRVSARVEMGAD